MSKTFKNDFYGRVHQVLPELFLNLFITVFSWNPWKIKILEQYWNWNMLTLFTVCTFLYYCQIEIKRPFQVCKRLTNHKARDSIIPIVSGLNFYNIWSFRDRFKAHSTSFRKDFWLVSATIAFLLLCRMSQEKLKNTHYK